MLVFFLYITTLTIIFLFVYLILKWIKEKYPKARNFAAFSIEFISAYSAFFVLDMLAQTVKGEIPFNNVISPVFTWTGISVGCHYLALWTTKSVKFLYIPYLVFCIISAIGIYSNFYYAIITFILILVSILISKITVINEKEMTDLNKINDKLTNFKKERIKKLLHLINLFFISIGVFLVGYFLGNTFTFIALLLIGIILIRPSGNLVAESIYFSNIFIIIILGLCWGILISYLLNLIIDKYNPNLLLIIFGYLTGIYVSIMNYSQFVEPQFVSEFSDNLLDSYQDVLNIISIISFITFSIILYFY